MRRQKEPIEIKEPPIQELTKKRSCLKSTCLTGCIFMVLFIIASVLLIRYIAVPHPKILKQVPANFPTNIPIYDHDNIDTITYISGPQKTRGREIANLLPRFILSPVIVLLNQENNNPPPAPGSNIKDDYSWENLSKSLDQPLPDSRNVIQIEWSDLPAEPTFIKDYLIEELKTNYYYEVTTNNDYEQRFVFKDNKGIDGSFYIKKNDLSKKGTDYMSLIVNYPNK